MVRLTQFLVFLVSLHVATSFLPIPPVPSTPTFSRSLAVASEAPTDAPFRGAQDVSSLTANIPSVFTSADIEKILPHRYPFALVDKVIEYVPGKSAVGVKSITLNEPQFTGHFPGRPIMPGVMQVEAMAQLAGIVCLQMEGANPGDVFFFAGVDGVK